jgi:hypothetical protein
MKDILIFCTNYNKNTKIFYPNLTINDIYFDQKNLKSIVSYVPLILDAIGLQGNTKNFELRLAT